MNRCFSYSSRRKRSIGKITIFQSVTRPDRAPSPLTEGRTPGSREPRPPDWHCRVPVPFVTAALGGSIEVATLDGGRAKVAIPEGTQPGRHFRLKAKGMPVLRSAQRGDLYIEVAVETPVKLCKRQKELLREFENESKAGCQPEAEGFMARLKEFWNGGETA